MKWFRLYHDLPNDRKLRKFSSQQKWAWVVLLCLASESEVRGIVKGEDESDIADYCGFECTQDYLYFLDKLRQKDMIEPIEGGFKITHWEDRQYIKPSDLPEATKERKRKQRLNQKAAQENESRVTSSDKRVTSRHTDTDPETETETETETENTDPHSSDLCRLAPTQSGLDLIFQIYNQDKPQHWAACKALNEKRRKTVRAFLKEHKDRSVEVFQAALHFAAQDPFWSDPGKKFDFDTLFEKNRAVQFAERWDGSNQETKAEREERIAKKALENILEQKANGLWSGR